MQDELHPRPDIVQVHEQVPGLLDHPRLDRMLRDSEDAYPAAAVLNNGKDVDLRSVEQELGEGLRERIRARTDPIPESLSGLVDQAEDVWAVMGTVRNRIAHGSDRQPRSAQLEALTRLAHTVAIGAALNLLGVPDTVLCAAIDQARWPVI
jgi:hypothetical protein